MFSFAKKLPANWPSPLHHKCNNSKCRYPNTPKPTPGTYECHGCSKGTYKVSRSTASAVDTQSRQIFPLYHTRPINAPVAAPPARTLCDDVSRGVPMRSVGEMRTMKALDSWGEPLSRSNAVRKRTESRNSEDTASSSSHSRSGYRAPVPPRIFPPQVPPSRQQYVNPSQAYYSARVAPAPASRPVYQYRVYNQ